MAIQIEVITASSPQAAGSSSRPQDDMMISIKQKRLIDKILTLESKIKIPIRNISSLRYAEPTIIEDRKRLGMSRAVGLRYGKRYIVGTYVVEWEREKVTFWNIHSKDAAAEKRVLIMELRNERYNEIILEVDDCERVIEELRQVIGQDVITT
jgi:hypothetical protein